MQTTNTITTTNQSFMNTSSCNALHEWLLTKYNEQDFARAKYAYFKELGEVHDDHPEFENRMIFFMDWFAFYYAPRYGLPTPFEIYKNDIANTSQLNDFKYSIYKICFISGDSIVLSDFFTNERIVVRPMLQNTDCTYLNRGQILQMFVYQTKSKNFMSQGIIYHPMIASKTIESTLKLVKNKKNYDKIFVLEQLAKTQLRSPNLAHSYLQRLYSSKTIIS